MYRNTGTFVTSKKRWGRGRFIFGSGDRATAAVRGLFIGGTSPAVKQVRPIWILRDEININASEYRLSFTTGKLCNYRRRQIK